MLFAYVFVQDMPYKLKSARVLMKRSEVGNNLQVRLAEIIFSDLRFVTHLLEQTVQFV